MDFIGIRDTNEQGVVAGEHCLVGLFSRAATSRPLADFPFARGRIAQVFRLAGVRPEGFRAEKFLDILESLPRSEVLEAQPEWLAAVSGAVVALYKRPRAKVFARRDVYGRHLNVLVYMPRELYSATLSDTLADTLHQAVDASGVLVQTLLSDGPLARLYLIAREARPDLDLEHDIQQPLLAVLEGWHTTFDDLADANSDAAVRTGLRKLCLDLPAEYIALTTPLTAYHDLCSVLAHTDTTRVQVRVDQSVPVSIRLLSVNTVPSLSKILPAMHNAGVVIEREQTYDVACHTDGARVFITCLSPDAASAEKLLQAGVADAARELFESLFNNEAEDGRLNALVTESGMRLKHVQVIRAYASYWRQAGCRFSLRYIAECLKDQAHYVRRMTDAFLVRFNPDFTPQQRDTGTAELHAIYHSLANINHADSEELCRTLIELMLATLRTSYFQEKQQGDIILFKFDTSKLNWLPQPRPYREIFVFSRRFEGLHLRGGPVARGGLRWSDRMEDYRTEVLGLVKAQMVKNAVIVPVGAKGGFVCKMVPKDIGGVSSREVIAREGEAVYRLFIAGLLDLTDNRVQGRVVHPPQTVCLDDDDPYLVVAADKGTATFSDIANSIAVGRGFWLGDAFASGGSNGYDHKKLGITAKGAWESVKRHFYELGHNWATTAITVIGVGDMSGDVFGNGLLLSHQIRLVAAFDHRHIFIDPNPDLSISFAERQRLFALPRSSWDDYNKELISAGGGVFSRSVRSINLSAQAQAILSADQQTVTPEQLMQLILLAPADLFYNGGIGTYIKASTETHAQVKDRANDAIRVDGNAVRCKVVAEGGNLGVTQAGRIEFALNGGHIFTDAIDNSAGVDCSDHEVNVKIWLDAEVHAGSITAQERNRLLTVITDDIERLVLRDNTRQTHLLERELQAQKNPVVQDAYADLLINLEAEGVLSRTLEQLPGIAGLARRKEAGMGLTAPELAVVIAYVKNRYKRLLSELPLTQQAWADTLLTPYFPAALVATRSSLAHPLANPILGTVLANEAVNRCGPVMLSDLAKKYAVTETSVILAWSQAVAALNLAPLFAVLDAHALRIPKEVSLALDIRLRLLQQAVTEGVLSVPEQDMTALTSLFSDPSAVALLCGDVLVVSKDDCNSFVRASQMVDALTGMADFVFAALAVPLTAQMDLAGLLHIGLQLRRQSGIARLERVLTQTVSPHKASLSAALCTHATETVRRTQRRLLELALQPESVVLSQGAVHMDVVDYITVMLTRLGIPVDAGNSDSASLEAAQPEDVMRLQESAVLEVWTLSEAAFAGGYIG